MKIVVLKFGGTSVGSIERIKKVVKIINSYHKKRYKIIVLEQISVVYYWVYIDLF